MKDDNEEKNAQFDGETVKKVKVNEPKSIWLGGDKYRVTRTDEIPDELLSRVLS